MGTSGTPLNLTEPASGTTNWGAEMNANLSSINAAIAALQAGGSAGPAGPTGPTGAVGMIYTGPWSSLVNYVPTNAVLFNGSTYIATSANVNAEPDTHPTSWAILAAAGAAGAAGATGATGPAGPPGSGSGVTFPITLAEGGTGVAATTTLQVRTALGAAASGTNTDIHALDGISGVQLTSGELAISNGTQSCLLTAQSLGIGIITQSPGGGGLQIGTTGTVGLLSLFGPTVDSLLVTATALPACTTGQIGFAATVAPTATAGGGQATPGTVLGYLIFNNQGTLAKIPFYAA